MSDVGVIDFAGLDSAATTTAADTSTPVVETPVTTPTDTQTDVSSTPTEVTEASDKVAATDGTQKTTEETKGSISNPTVQEIHKSLQAWKDSDPEKFGAMAKSLNNVARREFEYQKTFGSVTEAKEVSSLLREVANIAEGQPLTAAHAREAIGKLQSSVANAKAIDQQLYEGSPDVITAITEDLKTQGRLDALGKLLGPMAESCRENDPQGFVNHQRTLFLSAASDCGLVDSLNSLHDQLAGGKTQDALKTLKSIGSYFSDLQRQESDKEKEAAVVKRERGQLETQKTTHEAAEKEVLKTSIAKGCESVNNKTLGSHLGSYLKTDYFRSFSRENLAPLGNTLKYNLYQALKQDAGYQQTMQKLWGAKTVNRAEIERVHKDAVSKIAKDITDRTIKTMYPNYKPTATAAAGRAAAKNTITAPAAVKQGTKSTAPSATMVAVKPEWNEIDWTKDEKQHLYITGKAYLKKTGQLVAWRR